jgi:polyvinyl alcohol dehydrogenase (cytochrome)
MIPDRRFPQVLMFVVLVLVESFMPGNAKAGTDQPLVPDGASLYHQRCSKCHDAPATKRVPNRRELQQMPAASIVEALSTGAMHTMADTLTPVEQQAIAAYLTRDMPSGSGIHRGVSREDACPTPTANFSMDKNTPHWNGWGVDLSNKRFQLAAMAGLTVEDVPRIKVKWAFGFQGASLAFSQPAVAGENLIVGGESGKVFALNARSGCTKWTFQAQGSVRTGFVISPRAAEHSVGATVYFGDQHGAVYALNASTGTLLWKEQADTHPAAMITGTPQLWQGRLYAPVASYEENFAIDPTYECCTFRGSVVALDAASGKQVWKTYMIADQADKTGRSKSGKQLWGPSGVGVWSSPTLDPEHGLLYVGTGNNYSGPATSASDAVLALSMDSGKILWTRQMTPNDAYNSSCVPVYGKTTPNCPQESGEDFDFGSSPILVTLHNGHRLLIAGQKSGIVYGLDPDREGKVVWQTRLGKGGPLGGVEWGLAVDLSKVYAAISDCDWGSFELTRNGQKKTVFGVLPDKGGGLFALDLADGAKVWATPPPAACQNREQCSPAQLAAVTAIPGVVFSGSLDGHLRAYSSWTGRIIWDFDTERDFKTVNGITAHGGSLNGPGSVVVNGMLYVNSGYGRFGEMAGNVFLAFSVDGK